jgi:hypothetical protein
MRYVVTVSQLNEVTVTLDAPPDATRDQLRELVLQRCDDGEAEFAMTGAETIVKYNPEWPTPLHELEIRMRSPL